MHVILAETEYSALAGTRSVCQDLIEFPSQLFEKFLTNATFIQTWAKDIDGTPVPESMVHWMNEDRQLFSTWKKLEHNCIAYADLKLNSDPNTDVNSIMEDAAKFSDNYVPSTHWVSSV